MIRGNDYNARLEALLSTRIGEIDGRWAGTSVDGTAVSSRPVEVLAQRGFAHEHRNLSLDREVLGLWGETQILDGAERMLVSTTQGNVLEIFSDGSVQWHTPGDLNDIVEGDRNVITGGAHVFGVGSTLVVEVGDSVTVVRGDTTITISDSTLSIDTDVPIDVTTAGNATITSPNATITGGSLTVDGQASINPSSGPFCALTNCLFTGAPHRGNVVSGT